MCKTSKLFLDQSGELGGAELCLLDIATYFKEDCKVILLSSGPFYDSLRRHGIEVEILAQNALGVRKHSDLFELIFGLISYSPLVFRFVQKIPYYDLLYANTPKALVLASLARFFTPFNFVYHLHDIISKDHFSNINRRVIVSCANQADLVIANSQSSKDAFIRAGGKPKKLAVVYNGFKLENYSVPLGNRNSLRRDLQLTDHFVIGHFSRLSPWKGQHILLEALHHCPHPITVLLVGAALFGEDDYVAQLHHQVKTLGLEDRVKFLGFRQDIPQLMAACDLVTHTSTAPEPFGRVIVEAMLCGTPVIATAAGGAIELVTHGRTGWLCPPSDPQRLAELISDCYIQPERNQAIAEAARLEARERFDLQNTNSQLATLLKNLSDQAGA
jgi:glycosyltransferase involved in cell wall biosynthesis